MPVTKTAERALRSSKRKAVINKKLQSSFEASVRTAQKSKKTKDVVHAVSLTDRARKKGLIHQNKAARIKSRLTKTQKPAAKKSSI
jgi:small subunit ribosomal protein S20